MNPKNQKNSTQPSSQPTPSTPTIDLQLVTTVPSTTLASSAHQNGECSVDGILTEPVPCEWSLPETPPFADPIFKWGPLDALSFIAVIEKAYDEVVHWKMNLFPVPFGKAGKQFVSELARLYRAFAEGSALESISLKAATVLTTLALQKPYRNSKAKAHSHYLERRLASWLNGDIDNMLNEGHTIKNRCFKRTPTIS